MHCQASAGTEPPPDDEVSVKGDWREFRASLVSTEQGEGAVLGTPDRLHASMCAAQTGGCAAAPGGGDVWSTRWCQENLHLLQQQARQAMLPGPRITGMRHMRLT
jgi:hypothetical protein